MLSQVRCVMFDLDGTLVDSAPDIAISLNIMLQQFDFPTHDLQQVRDWMGNGAARLIKRALTGDVDGEPNEELFFQAQQLFFDIYDQYICTESTVYQGVLEGLAELQNKNLTMAIVTNKPRRFTPALLHAFKLDQYFEHIICGDDLPVKKPNPKPLYDILDKAGLKSSQALMVGDSASDIQAGKAANLHTFCVTYGYHQGKGVDALGASYIIDSIAEIPQYLQ